MENIAPTKFGPVDRSGRLQNRLYLLRAAVVDRRAMASLGIAAFCSTAADGSRTFVVLTAECTDLATLRPRLPPDITEHEWSLSACKIANLFLPIKRAASLQVRH